MAAVVKDVGAGLVASLLSLATCLSYGALIFAGPLEPFLSQGVSAALITAAVIGILVALTSGFRCAVAGPDSNTAVLLATMMAMLGSRIGGERPGEQLVTVMAVLALATVVTGAVVALVGWRRLGKFVRYVPYPVIAGFLAATGWLMVAGAVRMATGLHPSLAGLAAGLEGWPAVLLGLTIAWALALALLLRHLRHALTLPLALVAAIVATDLVVSALGMPLTAARHVGLLFDVGHGSPPMVPLLAASILHVHWLSLPPRVLAGIVSVVIMALLTILLNATGIELVTRSEIDLDRELRMQGLANLASGLLGGFVGYITISRTLVNRTAGAVGRLSGVVVGLVALAALTVAGGAVSLVPRYVLGGMLLMLGAELLWQWGVASRRRLPLKEWLVVVAIVAITAWFSFLFGLLFGVLAACVIFCLDVSRTPLLRRRLGLDERPSTAVRTAAEMAVLHCDGGHVQVLELDGYIFFGSAYGLQQALRRLLEEQRPELVILDFTEVDGIDSSAVAGFARIRQILADAGVRQAMAALTTKLADMLEKTGGLDAEVRLYADLDLALQDAEVAVLAAAGVAHEPEMALQDWLGEVLGDPAQARVLVERLTPVALAEDGCVARQGDPADALFFVERGRVAVLMERTGRSPWRVRAFGTHTVAGEVSFFRGGLRTATLQAEEGAVVWALTRPAFAVLQRDHPGVFAALCTYIIRRQAEALEFVTKQLAMMRR